MELKRRVVINFCLFKLFRLFNLFGSIQGIALFKLFQPFKVFTPIQPFAIYQGKGGIYAGTQIHSGKEGFDTRVPDRLLFRSYLRIRPLYLCNLSKDMNNNPFRQLFK